MLASLSLFVRRGWHVLEPGVELEWNWHHEALCLHIQAILEDWIRTRDDKTFQQRCQNLAINVGPISLKSRIVMVFAVAWMWLRVPEWSVLCASGTPSNVDRDSLACRDLVTSGWYRDSFHVEWEIRDDLDRIAKWGTTAGGMRESRGLGGSFTGIHVDAIFLDDPDDAAKVWSESARSDTWVTWKGMGNRVNSLEHVVRLVMQQNLHDEDLTSKLVRDGWERFFIPLEFDPKRRFTSFLGWTDPRTVANENMHPARFSPKVIAAERTRLGSHGFEAQYNCNAAPIEGGMIKRAFFRFFRVEDVELDGIAPRPRPDGCTDELAYVLQRDEDGALDIDWLTITVDATFGSTSDSASAVGLLVIGGKEQNRFVFEDSTDVMTFLATVAAIKAAIRRWPVGRVLVELKANGASVIETLKKEMADGDLLGPDGQPVVVVVEPITPEGGKTSRAAAMVPEIEAGTVFLLDGAHWLEAFIGEVCVFPNGRRDDRVDALSQLMAFYRVVIDTMARWRALSLL